jgi:hypothetical protein
MRSRMLAIGGAALALGCGGPLLLLPGGRLEGAPAEPPTDWAFAREVKTVQLETRPSDPYSVNIWAVGSGAGIWVHAGASRSAWVAHMEAEPDVRLQVEGRVYALRATRVEAQDEFDRFSDAYEAKYGSRPRNEDVKIAYLFRLEAR